MLKVKSPCRELNPGRPACVLAPQHNNNNNNNNNNNIEFSSFPAKINIAIQISVTFMPTRKLPLIATIFFSSRN
jgi:hypothetical protein